MRESALWRSLSRCAPSSAMAVRIENSAESGTPDVVVAHAGHTVFIELKTNFHISKQQIDWARRWNRAGGKSYFLIKIDNRLYFIPGHLYRPDLNKWRIANCHEVFEIIKDEDWRGLLGNKRSTR